MDNTSNLRNKEVILHEWKKVIGILGDLSDDVFIKIFRKYEKKRN